MELCKVKKLQDIINDENSSPEDKKFAHRMLYGNCRSCGKEISRQFLEEKALCTLCGNKCVPDNPKEVHIIFSSYVAKGLLKEENGKIYLT